MEIPTDACIKEEVAIRLRINAMFKRHKAKPKTSRAALRIRNDRIFFWIDLSERSPCPQFTPQMVCAAVGSKSMNT
jgi:hypothetical protein